MGETVSKSWTLGVASAVMVALGYPGEIQSNPSGRWMWWFFAMIPFLYVVAELAVGLSEASQKLATTHGPSVASLTGYARRLTVISWLTYPFVYIIKMLGISGVTATACEQIGYSVADVVAKAVFGVLIWAIADAKSKFESEKLVALAVSDASFPFEVCFHSEREATSRVSGTTIVLLISVATQLRGARRVTSHSARNDLPNDFVHNRNDFSSWLWSDVSRLGAADRAERKHAFSAEHAER